MLGVHHHAFSRCLSLYWLSLFLICSQCFFCIGCLSFFFFFFFQAEDGIRDRDVTGVQTCALPICGAIRESAYTRILGNSIAAEVEFPRIRVYALSLIAPPVAPKYLQNSSAEGVSIDSGFAAHSLIE